MISRTIKVKVISSFFKQRAVVIYGARQVGKTTLIKDIQKQYNNSIYLNCDEIDVREALTEQTSTALRELIGNNEIIFIDEAQRVKNIGITLKLLVDNFPNQQIVATGSSSLDLSNELKEPLTGRKFEFHLYPLSYSELKQTTSSIDLKRLLELRMIYGLYPEVFMNSDRAEIILNELSSSYLYKDILQYQNIKHPDILDKLLRLLAFQVGSEVSYNELASKLGVSKETVANYVDLLEKSFVIFRLGPFSRNLRNELTKMRKIYFYDNGIRNALIRNFNSFEFRDDIGSLWENFIISEYLKKNAYQQRFVNNYFWRTHQRQEIDLIEEKAGVLHAYEIKWNPKKKSKIPKQFQESYKDSTFEIINRDSFLSFIT